MAWCYEVREPIAKRLMVGPKKFGGVLYRIAFEGLFHCIAGEATFRFLALYASVVSSMIAFRQYLQIVRRVVSGVMVTVMDGLCYSFIRVLDQWSPKNVFGHQAVLLNPSPRILAMMAWEELPEIFAPDSGMTTLIGRKDVKVRRT